MLNRLATVVAAALIAGCAVCDAATIGRVDSWSRSGAEVVFNIAGGPRLRTTVLANDLVRFTFAPDGLFTENVSRAVVDTQWPAVDFTVSDNGTAVTIVTEELRVEVIKSICIVRIKDSTGVVILSDDPSRRIYWDSGTTRAYKLTASGESYLGLGWRTQPLRRNGTVFAMRNRPTYNDPTVFYGGVPMWYGLTGGKAYAIFFDDASWGSINAGAESSQYMSFSNAGGQLDYYFIYGPAIGDILDRYTRLTGRPYMPPKWACGYQQCRWSYTPQADVTRVADAFRSHGIPCDALYLDIDYMNRGDQLTFEPGAFPNPSGLCSYLHSRGFNVIANISPWLLEGSSKYNTALAAGYLLNNGGSPIRGWHDYVYFVMNAPTGWISWVDFSNSAARQWYAAQHAPFLGAGIDGIWNDLNEPDEFATWPESVNYSFDGRNVSHNKTSNQYCLLQSDFSYDVLRNQYPDRRPFVLSRAAYAGMQRSAAVWSGDNTSDWTNDFKRNIPMGLSMSLCGQPHNGHDIGGFYGYPNFGTKPSGELFARWMQAGVFSAFCRAHHNGDGVRQAYPYCEPWEFDSTTENICRNYIGLRYRLMPYLYSLFYDAHTTGAPVQRPTVYDFQQDANTIYQDYEFMFGPSMLVAPVYTAGATTRQLYLPAGAGWTDWHTGARYAGGQTITVPAPLDRAPILARDGAIIPMGPLMQYADQLPVTQLDLKLYPAAGVSSSFRMFEDDGIGWGYQTGNCATTLYSLLGSATDFALLIGERVGNYVPAARHYGVQAHGLAGANYAVLDAAPLQRLDTPAQLEAADRGWCVADGILHARFPDTAVEMMLKAGIDTTPPVINSLNAAGCSVEGHPIMRVDCGDPESGITGVAFSLNGEHLTFLQEPGGEGWYIILPISLPGLYEVTARATNGAGLAVEASIWLTTVADLSTLAQIDDGSIVAVTQAQPVAAVVSGDPTLKQRYVLVENSERTEGIRVATGQAARGDRIVVAGVMRTPSVAGKAQPERYLDAGPGVGGVTVVGQAEFPEALAMVGRSAGALSTGLSVRLWGKVLSTGECEGYAFFRISDGSVLPESHDLLAAAGSTDVHRAIRVYCAADDLPEEGDFVIVDGAAGLERPAYFDETNPVVRASENGIRVLVPGAVAR